jgi:hypothetical protein
MVNIQMDAVFFLIRIRQRQMFPEKLYFLNKNPCIKYFGALHLFSNCRIIFYKDYWCSAPER